MKKLLFSILLFSCGTCLCVQDKVSDDNEVVESHSAVVEIDIKDSEEKINSEKFFSVEKSDDEIRQEALEIFEEAAKLFQFAEDHFDKFLYSTYKKDRLTFKEFSWAFKGLVEGINCRTIRPLEELQASIRDDKSLAKALSIILNVASELHAGISQLCKALHPYERTKKRSDAYKVAKLIKSNVEKFLTQERFNRYQKNLDEVLDLLTTKSGFNELVNVLVELRSALSGVNDTTTGINELKVLNRIMNRIGHN